MQIKFAISRGIRLLMRHGIFGRKRQVECCFSWEREAGLNVNKWKWKQVYQEIQEKYKEIRVHRLWSTRIGEYVPRFLTAVEDSKENAKKGILDVFVLADCVNHNTRLSIIMGRSISIIDETNVDMWKYILWHFRKVEFTRYWDEYAFRNKDKLLSSENTVKYFHITKDEEKEGNYKKELMGLHTSYVCISSRDAAYLNKVEPEADCSYHDYRDSDINLCNLAAGYLSTQGIITVRMGRYIQNKVTFNNCIDYAFQYYDELMDIILLKDCKFYLGDSNGICIFPMAFNRPVALKNVIPAFLDSWGTHPQNSQNMFIFKKYYSKVENRFLSIREMMQIDKQVAYDGHKYAKMQVEIIENSAEEILDLVIEMNSRIDGEWVEKPEDIELQRKYQVLLEKWVKEAHLKENAIYRGRVGTMFLKKNSFLLD